MENKTKRKKRKKMNVWKMTDIEKWDSKQFYVTGEISL